MALSSPACQDYRVSRERMVSQQLLPRGITDKAVLNAMATVPRHIFVPEALEPTAYDDRPLPIGAGQTISQPYIVALMTQLLALKPGMSVLEIGTGSGYQAAILHSMGVTVFTVERLREHYLAAQERLNRLGMRSLRMRLADGTLGWPEMAPFDRILVAAGGPDIPRPLVEQLADPGMMVVPVGKGRGTQQLVRVRRQHGRVGTQVCGEVTFVDLIGSHGW